MRKYTRERTSTSPHQAIQSCMSVAPYARLASLMASIGTFGVPILYNISNKIRDLQYALFE